MHRRSRAMLPLKVELTSTTGRLLLPYTEMSWASYKSVQRDYQIIPEPFRDVSCSNLERRSFCR